MFCKISMNATLEFGNRCFFKDMIFYGHEFFRTISDSFFKITFISGSEIPKSYDNCPYSELFCSAFSIIWTEYGTRENTDQSNSEYGDSLRSIFHGFDELPFWNFRKNKVKKPRVGVYVLLCRRSQELRRSWDICLGDFLEFPEEIISRATVKYCFWAF